MKVYGYAAGAGAAVLVGAVVLVPAGAQSSTAEINIVHGLPGGGAIDVCIEATNVVDGLAEGARVTLESTLEAGTYGITAAEDAPENDCATPIAVGSVDVVDGQTSLDIITALSGAGEPTVLLFANDTEPTGNGEGRITLRHTAAVGSVDATVDEQQFTEALANGLEATSSFAAGDRTLTIFPAGVSDPPLVPSEVVALAAGTEEVRYLVGGSEDASVLAFTRTVGEAGATTSRRLFGDNREGTAVAISQEAYPDGADVVYITRRDAFPDAMAAKSLQDGPLLFAAPCGYSNGALLLDTTAAEIERLDPNEVIALGGETAICDDVLDAALAAAQAAD